MPLFKPFSKRELEGYVCIDHTDSPGFTPELAVKAGFHNLWNLLGKGRKTEMATSTCSHCERQVILRPDRSRERPWCWKCDHYICDECGFESTQPGYQHASYREKLDAYLLHVRLRSGGLIRGS